jgi:uncharacterized protein
MTTLNPLKELPPRPARFGTTPARRMPYKGVDVESRYLRMRDGTKIAIDVMRPGSAPSGLTLPAIVIVARYWRSFALRGIAPPNQPPIGPRDRWLPKLLLGHGYALVTMDTRGSGASTGSTPHPFNEQELADYGEVVDWIISQPWSNGSVGAYGISYEGIAAELLTVAHPGAIKAVVPQQADVDWYTDVMFPGGILNEWMSASWQRTNDDLDRNRVPDAFGRMARLQIKGVRPVDADTDGSLLRRAIGDHAENADFEAATRAITYRDDPFGSTGVPLDGFSTIRYRDEVERSGAAIFSWGSWLDGTTADGVLRRFATYSNPHVGVIGAWSHHFLNHGSPYPAAGTRLRPARKELWQEVLAHFDRYLKHPPRPEPDEKQLFYYTLGEEAWKVTGAWPPVGHTISRWFLAPEGTLSPDAPTDSSGADTYDVDFEATTGLTNRWHTQDGVTKVDYPDRSKADQLLLTYTSLPLEEDVEVTGHPVITLYVRSTARDGGFYAYLEDVDPDGRVIYLTEGHLRAIHRRISDQQPALKLFVPYHTYLREDAMPLVPGEVAELRFGLLPVSALVCKGHRLRVAIAGHDQDTFARIPQTGHPTITVQRTPTHSSHIDLPTVPR